MAEFTWFDKEVDRLMGPGGEVHDEVLRRAVKVVRAAKRRAPVDTGRLRSSITSSDPERRGHDTLVVKIGTNVDYAVHVEFGTSRMRAQPYLRPSLDAAR